MPQAAHRRLLLFGGRRIVYLLRDLFTTTQAAPITSPRTAEPGPGTLTAVDGSNIVSIAGGRLVFNGTPAAATLVRSTTLFTRTIGRAFLVTIPTRTAFTGVPLFSFDSNSAANTVPEMGAQYGNATDVSIRNGNANVDTITIGAGTHYLILIQMGAGGILLARNGSTGAYTLLWVFERVVINNQYAKISSRTSAAVNIEMSSVRVLDLPAPWNIDYGPATNRIATTSAGSTTNSTADAIIEHTITAATGVQQDMLVRRLTDTDCWDIRMDQGGSTVALIEIVGGVETSRGSTAQTWTNGIQYRVVDIQESSTIKVFVANVSKISYASATTQQTTTGVKVSRAGSDLVAWPRTVSLPNGV